MTRRLAPLALLALLAAPSVARAQYSYRRAPVWGGGGIGASRSAEQIAADQAKHTRQPYIIYVAQPGYVIIPQQGSTRTASEWESAQSAYQSNTAEYRSGGSTFTRTATGSTTAPVTSYNFASPATTSARTRQLPAERPRDPGAVAADYRRKFGTP